jgi:uncharacterized protein (DUF302 family)
MTPDGLITRPSSYGAKETMDRLAADVEARGMTVFARVDHAAGARSAGLELRPTELLLFGNPRGGTPLMQAAQTIGIDLPLRVLVWQDEDLQTWLSYDDPAWLAQRHRLGEAAGPVVVALTAALAAVAQAATAADPA